MFSPQAGRQYAAFSARTAARKKRQSGTRKSWIAAGSCIIPCTCRCSVNATASPGTIRAAL